MFSILQFGLYNYDIARATLVYFLDFLFAVFSCLLKLQQQQKWNVQVWRIKFFFSAQIPVLLTSQHTRTRQQNLISFIYSSSLLLHIAN